MKTSNKLVNELEKMLGEVIRLSRQDGKKTGICIGNTTKKIDRDFFFTPIRNTQNCVCGSIVIDRVSIAETVAKTLDGKVDYLFVDTEKKISPERYGNQDVGNVERAVRRVAVKSKVLTYKGNDLVVDAMDCFLAQSVLDDERGLGGKKVAIVGAGNVGFKIALKLMERGCHVFMVRRNIKKLSAIVRALNYIKPQSTLARVHGTTQIRKAIIGADILIGLTPGTGDISGEMIRLVKPAVLLIDAGKGSFSPEAVKRAEERGIPVYRSGVIASFDGQVTQLLKMEELLHQGFGRKLLYGIPVVAGGIVGKKGEIVLDDLREPTQIFGIADGSGDFNRNPSPAQAEQLDRLREKICETENEEESRVIEHAN